MKRRSIFKFAFQVSCLNLLGKLAGVIRDLLLASRFGISQVMDVFIIVSTLPQVFGSIIQSAMTSVFIPIYGSYIACNGKDDANRFANTILILIAIGCFVFIGLGIYFSEYVVHFTAPGLSGEYYHLAVVLAKYLMPSILFFCLLAFFIAVQQTNNEFFFSAIAGLFNNLTIILSVLLFSSSYGIITLTIATTAAVLVQVLVQLPGILKCGFKVRLNYNFKHPGVSKMFHLLLPISIATAANQINVVIINAIGSKLPEGTLSALGYAYRINDLMINLFIMSLITVVYPTLTEYYANKNVGEFYRYINIVIKFFIFVTIPFSAIIIALSIPIVEILLERGVFSHSATIRTASTLQYYAVGILGIASFRFFNQVFYAQQNTQAPTVVSMIVVLLNVVLSYFLTNHFPDGGLALATSISISTGAIILLMVINKKSGCIPLLQHFKTLMIVVLSSACMGAEISCIYQLLFAQHETIFIKLLRIALSGIIGLATYLLMIFIFLPQDFRLGVQFLQSKRMVTNDKSY